MFGPEEYWTASVKLAKDRKSAKFTADVVKKDGKKLSIHNGEEAAQVTADLKAASYSVTDSSVKDRVRRPYAPFTTSSLQQEAVKHLNFTTRRAMLVAQQLYEGVTLGRKGSVGLITYMRTDSVHLADAAVSEIRGYVDANCGPDYLPRKPNVYSSRKNAQEAHEAIRPTDVKRTPAEVAKYLDRDQLRLYTLIWNRTVACQMASSISAVTTLVISAGAYELRAAGSVIKFDGFLKLMDKKEVDAEKTKKVPNLPKGTELVLIGVDEAQQHFTEPPANYTEATLVKELEEKGIGRPSTYATIINTILSRGYVAKEGKKILPTELGKLTVEMLSQYFKELIDVKFSAHMEDELDAISEHKADKEKVLEEFYEPFAKALEVADKNIPVVEKPVEVSDEICPNCHSHLIVKEGRHGKFLACPQFPKCRYTKPILVKIGVACPKCGHDIIERHSKTGRLFYGCSNYPECRFTSWDKPVNQKCPVCGSIMLEATERGGKKVLYCSNEECTNGRPRKKTVRKTKRGNE